VVNVLRIHADDNVVMALHELDCGSPLQWEHLHEESGLTVHEAVPFGHKVATAPIAEGDAVIKYGAPIGVARQDIAAGEHVHVHNLRSVRGAANS
jgi:altronate hydrolase